MINMTEKEYNNCKLIIKTWEKKFKEKEERNPTKEDIKIAPGSVKDAYKLYWYIKTSLLEEVIIEDKEPCQKEESHVWDTEPKKEHTRPSDVTSSIRSPSELDKVTNLFQQTKADEDSVSCSRNNTTKFINKETVWGNHLRKVTPVSRETSLKKSTSYQFTEKLFKGLKFKKRNPRKLINFSEKSKSLDNSLVAADEDCQNVPEINSCPVESSELSPVEKKIFDVPSSVTVTCGKYFNLAQPINISNVTVDLLDVRHRVLNNKIDEGWLARCEKQCGVQNSNSISMPNFEYTKEDTMSTVPSSDEDYVYSSEDEMSKTNCTNLAPKTSVISSSIRLDCESVEKMEKSSVVKEDLFEVSSMCKPIDPVIAAKNLINSCRNDGSGGVKRQTLDNSSNLEKKMKTLSNYDIERKIKLLENKVSSGKANENFVSIDLKRKRFVRGQKGSSYMKYKKQDWKMKKKVASMQSNNSSMGVLKCFKCGDVGHYSKQCKKKNVLLPMEEFIDIEESPFPTLEEASEMAKAKQKLNGETNEVAEMLEMCDSFEQPNLDEDLKSVSPLCDYNDDESKKNNIVQLYQALKKFGYDTFRSGQEKVMMRIISGKSTLFVSSTGSGKSLCYQIPAYLYAQRYQCISLVISPLVSLMEDQVLNFPSFLRAACLHTNQTTKQRDQIIESIKNNEISVLLISPEAMSSGEHGILGRSLMKNFPPVAFVCIDEVHCVSQWSHNFRTSYLIICRILKERFKVRTFLGLTATATMSTIKCVIEHIGIPKNETEDAVLQHTVLPDNLLLSVSKDENRDAALLELLKQSPFAEFKSIIIYCLRRNECERLGSFLRASLEDFKKPVQMFIERGAISAEVEVYHAGLSAARRKKVQNYFMNGKVRIVVATVAFGMGINKADIRGIIHYNMPRTFEHYVQEIGRAGRDGLPARCHLFYDKQGKDLPELKRHIFANSVDRYVIRKLLQKVFPQCNCTDTCEKHELAFSVDSTVLALDLNQESIATLLCYLELLPEQIVKVLPPAYTICTVQSFGGVKALQQAAKKCPPLAYAIAEHCKNSNSSKISSKFEFDVVALAEKIKWKSGVVKNELKQCEWKQVNGSYQKSAVSVTFHSIGFHVQSPGNLTEEKLDHALDALYKRVMSQENTSLDQLDVCDKAFKAAAYNSVEDSLSSDDVIERNKLLKLRIGKYFMEENCEGSSRMVETELKDKPEVMCNIHRLVSSHRDCNFTGRAIARIMYGIESPNYPTTMWYRSPFWRCGLNEDFNVLVRFASHELVKLKGS